LERPFSVRASLHHLAVKARGVQEVRLLAVDHQAGDGFGVLAKLEHHFAGAQRPHPHAAVGGRGRHVAQAWVGVRGHAGDGGAVGVGQFPQRAHVGGVVAAQRRVGPPGHHGFVPDPAHRHAAPAVAAVLRGDRALADHAVIT